MAGEVWFLTHGEVIQDPAVPVPDWGLSEAGRARHAAFNADLANAHITAIFSSDEQKARDGAAIHGAALGLTPRIHRGQAENDRSATGYLPPEEFEATANAFFARPETSIRGWERAVDAQARVLAALRACDSAAPEGNLLIVAHGGVGALTHAFAAGQPISRSFDQPGQGGGNLMRLARGSLALIEGWRRIG